MNWSFSAYNYSVFAYNGNVFPDLRLAVTTLGLGSHSPATDPETTKPQKYNLMSGREMLFRPPEKGPKNQLKWTFQTYSFAFGAIVWGVHNGVLRSLRLRSRRPATGVSRKCPRSVRGSVPENGGCPRECPTGCPRGPSGPGNTLSDTRPAGSQP